MTFDALRTIAAYSPDAPVRAADALAAVEGVASAAAVAEDYLDVERIAARLGCSVSKVRGDFAAGRVPDAYLFGSGKGEWRTTPQGYAAYLGKIEEEGRGRAAKRRRGQGQDAAGAGEPPLDMWRAGASAAR